MSELKVWYDGIELTQWLKVTMGKDEMLLPERIDDAISPGNRSGYELRSVKFGKRTIEMPFIISGDLRSKMSQIAQLLHTTETKKLIFSDRPERYYMAIPEGEIELPEKDVVDLTGTIKWICYDPYAYSVREDEFSFADEAETIDLTLDYAGKIFGDTSLNPNAIMGAQWHEIESRDPSSFWWEWEQINYAKVTKQDGVCGSYTRPDSEESRQSMVANNAFDSTRLMMKFNIYDSIEKQQPGIWQKYGLVESYAKHEWLAANMQSMSFDIWSYGHGGSGYGVKVQLWNGTEWTGNQTNSASKPTKNAYNFATANEAMIYIDSDGYFYALTGTNDASATVDSTTYLDYACIKMIITTPVADGLVVTNNGELPVPIRFEMTNHGQNGFLGISNDSEAILLGMIGQQDGGTTTRSERLWTTNQNNANGLKQWTLNDGVINTWNAVAHQEGNFEDPSVIKEGRWRLRNAQPDIATAWGKGDSNAMGWHGPSASATFPADSTGAVGAKNFTARFYIQYLFGNMNQSGLQECNLWGPDKELLVSVEAWKDCNAHNSFSIRIGNNWAWRDLNNARWDNFFGSILIKRFGNTYTIEIQNVEGSGPKTKQTISYDDPDSAAVLCEGMTYWKTRWGNTTSYNNVMYNDLYDFWFEKANVDHYVDVPNTFNENDTIVITGNDNKVKTTVNNTLAIGLQDVGSKPIMAYPGNNHVAFMYSDFASRPDVKAFIRKKYL